MGGAPTAHTITELLLLEHRGAWRNVPEGYRPVDRHPWRFRRRLSVLRRPLLQVDDDPDPMVLVCPGLMREAFGYTVSNYYRGDYPDWQLVDPRYHDVLAVKVCALAWRALAAVGRLRTLTACAASWCSGLGQSRPTQTGVRHVAVFHFFR